MWKGAKDGVVTFSTSSRQLISLVQVVRPEKSWIWRFELAMIRPNGVFFHQVLLFSSQYGVDFAGKEKIFSEREEANW